MAFKQGRTRVIIPFVEMTPMIDIVFLLIIFFMVAAQFAQQARVDLSLPKEQGEQAAETHSSTLIVSIRSDGEILMDQTSTPLSIKELDVLIGLTLMEQGASWQTISIRADEAAPARVLNDVLVLLNQHGLSATRLATEKP